MAQIEESSSGGRRSNVDLNLVPFIDLMSVCIIFLLITAVWTQVSMIQIGSSIYGKRTEQTPPKEPEDQTLLKLTVRKDGYLLEIGSQAMKVPKVQDDFDDPVLLQKLAQVKKDHPTKTEGIIFVEDDLKYENLIRGMDVLMNGGFPEISVASGGGP